MQARLFEIFVLLSVVKPFYGISKKCLNENGDPVDWYVVYKLPRLRQHPNTNIQQGVAYAYITSDLLENGWVFSNSTIDNPNSILGQTLSTVLSDPEDIFWIFYNDQPPNEPFTEKEGHTKGVVIGDENGGFWLVHSIPKFPLINKEQGYVYPKTGTVYGQSALCITLGKTNLEDIGNQLMINQANVYESFFGKKMELEYPLLKKAANKERLTEKMHKELITSANNEQFVSFAKSASFDEDLYSKWVAEILKCELFVETWLHEAKLSSDCNDTYEVHNVEKLSLNAASVYWKNFNDHAKWAVSAQKTSPWVCVGDINRAKTQFIRGGGTVCIRNNDLWNAYYNIVSVVEPCDSH